jgi:protein-tyrosine phosphatase
VKVLAVCAGNICRSPAAEAAIRKAAEEVGLEITADSAGTGSWNMGESPSPEAVAAGSRAGLQIEGRARKIHWADFDRFDVIVVMDQSNHRDVLSLAPSKEARAKVRLFRTYDPSSEDDEIPDPYGGSAQDYEQMIELVVASARGLIETLVSV